MSEFCNECWRLNDEVQDAQNQRAFVEQQVVDNGACMITRYKAVVMAVTAAVGLLEAHRLNCAIYIGERVTR